MARLGTLVLGLTAGLLSLDALEAEARACGGCFTPQETPTVVTDHRMIMSISQSASTLYDQIKYSGEPSSFAWVLPYQGTITVGLSSDSVFEALDQQTQTVITPPPGCGGNSSSGSANGGGASGSGGSSGSSGSGGVTVIKHETVGPYDTVQLEATDPAALEKWLAQNGFNIPADVKPVVDGYVGDKFNFLALKLLPNKGISDMRPVRVTSAGANLNLPLKMVAAGTGSTVGITLWVIADGRYEPQNYGSFIVDDNDLGWDVANARSNYTEVRTALAAKGNNAVWEIESSIFLSASTLQFYVNYYGGSSGSNDDDAPYLPEKDKNGNITKDASRVKAEDFQHLVPWSSASPRVTRMRADLAHAALTRDLTLRAAADQNLLSTQRQLFRCGLPGDPTSTVIDPGDNSTPAPAPATSSGASGAARSGSENDGTFTCATSTSQGRERAFGTIGSSILGIALARVIRRRRK